MTRLEAHPALTHPFVTFHLKSHSFEQYCTVYTASKQPNKAGACIHARTLALVPNPTE
jgi:hypothetical protein